ncbi:SMP-30/gluconolactonase/LRE family protein [Chondromyces crocatus]|uniref:Major royal jelly protein n=1 Tax=Chondromyces crocatus TaxID=52 RepID=A0A0K1EQN0_CHOCO|nr:major royal jelly family protein [Chondromyces crocatus]AKT42962.1 uncharacterized protein CMC5_071900 [Chondromyces crocatus]
MKAVVYRTPLPIDHEDSLLDADVPAETCMKTLTAILAATSLLVACQPPDASAPSAPTSTPTLTVAATSDAMIWNAVAVADDGRIFVSAPRWTGTRGPSLARLDAQGRPAPYPDAAWNAWKPGDDAAHAFVNINAIHRDTEGGLWVVDTGSPDFGGAPLPGGAKLVRIDLARDAVLRVYPFDERIATPRSYVDDLRFHGRNAYLTDAGQPGLIVLDIDTGDARRVLDGTPFTTASEDRPIVVDGQVLRAPDGKPLRVHADPLEVSPDGQWFYFAPLSGPMWRIETRWLDTPGLDDATLAEHVEPWFDLPAVGGTAMDADGTLYFTDLAQNALRKRTPDGEVETILTDPRLHWVDAPYLDARGVLWMPAPQMDRVALFNGGEARTRWPVELLTLSLR